MQDKKKLSDGADEVYAIYATLLISIAVCTCKHLLHIAEF